jgi:GGDEF domain-containing protein
VSAGFAYIEPAGTHSFEDWLHRADTMMYEQKRQKKCLPPSSPAPEGK